MNTSRIPHNPHILFLRRLAGFSGLPLLSVLTPFLLLPILARTSTKEVWSSIAIGQSVGSFAAIVVSFGWSLRGPAIVAQSQTNERPGLYVESLLARLFILVATLPAVVVIVIRLTPSSGRVIGISMAVVIALNGLSAAWFNIGEGRPSDIAIYEALPRMIATAIAAIALIMFREPTAYPVLLGIFTIAGIALFTRRICGNTLLPHLRNFSLRRSLRRSVPAAATVTSGAAYSSSAVAIVATSAPISSQSAYVSGDKIYGMGLYAITALANAFQGWVAEAAGVRVWERMKAAILAHAFLGVIGGVILGISGPAASRLLFGKGLETSRWTMIWMGASFFFVSLNTAVGRLVLTPIHYHRAVLVSTTLGAAVGVPLLVAGAAAAGSAGAAFGLAVSQCVVLMVQIRALMEWRSRLS